MAPKDERLLAEFERQIADGRRKYNETREQLARSRRLLRETADLTPDKLKEKDDL